MAQVITKLLGHQATIDKLIELAGHQHLPHGLIFTGPEGIGKFKAAQILAAQLIGQEGTDQMYHQAESLLVFDKDAGPLKIEQARDILQFLSLRSTGHARVVIIDEAHTMTAAAANALLKQIEEPGPDCYFILVTSNAAMLLPTIRSRCQQVAFFPLTREHIAELAPGPSWTHQACRGRVSVALRLNEAELSQQRLQALSLLQTLASRPQEPLNFGEYSTDRESVLWLLQWWQEVLRDALVPEPIKQMIIHQDQQTLLGLLHQQGVERLLHWSYLLLKAQQDIQANIDRQLLFDRLQAQMVS